MTHTYAIFEITSTGGAMWLDTQKGETPSAALQRSESPRMREGGTYFVLPVTERDGFRYVLNPNEAQSVFTLDRPRGLVAKPVGLR
jgi:hypothetical protein